MHMLVDPSPPESPEPEDGIYKINGWWIDADGIDDGNDDGSCVDVIPIRDSEIEAVKEFFSQCMRTGWTRKNSSPLASDVKHWIECWAGRYISTGAVIVSALQLGIAVKQYGTRNALLGINFESAAEAMASSALFLKHVKPTGRWHIARDHVTPTRIKPPPPPPTPVWTTEQWLSTLANIAKRDGVSLKPDPKGDPDEYRLAVDIARAAKEHGVDVGYNIDEADLPQELSKEELFTKVMADREVMPDHWKHLDEDED